MGIPYADPTNTGQWAQDLLSELGAPTSASNVSYVESWEQAESPSGFGYNPLGEETGATDSKNANKAGVQAYTSWGQGLAATVYNLISRPQNAPIVSALKQGNATPAELDAAQASPGSSWAGGPETSLTGQGTSNAFTYGGSYGEVKGAEGIASSAGNPTGWFGQWIEPIVTTNPVGVIASAPGTIASDAVSGVFGPVAKWIEEGAADVVFIGFGLLLLLIGLVVTFGHGASDEVNSEPAPVKDAAVAAVA